MRGRDAVRDLINRELVVSRTAHPELGPTLSRMLIADEISRVLPGIYGAPQPRWPTRVAAAMAWDPDAVICGRASAALDFWPDLRVDSIEVASSRQRARAPGFVFSQRRVPHDLIWSRSGLRRTSAPLTALDLCVGEVGGDAIDQVLRTRAATLADLHEAMKGTVHRPGNNARHRLLLESRAEPWSAAERVAHRLLRTAGIGGWVANHPVWLSDGEHRFCYYLDNLLSRATSRPRDRRSPAPQLGIGVRERPLSAERRRDRWLAGAAVHLAHAGRSARIRGPVGSSDPAMNVSACQCL